MPLPLSWSSMSTGFTFAAIAAGLSEAYSLWLSLLIVAGILLVVAAIAGFLAVRSMRKASRPRGRSRRQGTRSRRWRAMSEKRGVEEIRLEIAAERQRLDDDLNVLQAQLRSLLPLVVAGLAVVALVTFRNSTSSGLRLIWSLVEPDSRVPPGKDRSPRPLEHRPFRPILLDGDA